MKQFVVAKLFMERWQGSMFLASNFLFVDGLDTVLDDDSARSPFACSTATKTT
jgi:hypothetical protein